MAVEVVVEEDVDVVPTATSGAWVVEDSAPRLPPLPVDGELEVDRATVDLLVLEDPDSSLPLVEEDRTRP